IGTSVAGNMAAAHLSQQFPDLDIVIIGPAENKHPIVGESLTEFSTYFLHNLGYARYLEEKHFHKYGLSFYFKENLDNPAERVYSAHEAPAIPPMPSNQINRFTLDKRLFEDNLSRGIKFINAK